jgi:hypothetical protein
MLIQLSASGVAGAVCCRRTLLAAFVMLVPDRFCLALWLVISGARSTLRPLWSLLRRPRYRQTFSSSRRFGRVVFQDGIRVQSLALKMLARDGFAAIWVLHLSAARAYREGRKAAARAIIEIADAAEREWLRSGKAPRQIRDWKP